MTDEGTLRIMERAVSWTHLCFRDGVTEVSLTFIKDLMRRKDKRATRGGVADNFFGGRYRSRGTVVLRLSPESWAARAASPFLFGVERVLGGAGTEDCIYEPRSCRPKQDAMVRLADCAGNAAGYELWKAAWRCAQEVKQSLAATGERQPVEDVPLSPVGNDDVILYAPPETSRGVRADTYGWIPDTCCGVYHIEGGTESDYTDGGSAELVVAKGGMSDENRLRVRVYEQCSKSNLGFYVKHDGRKPRVRYVAIFPQSIVEEAEKDYLRRLQRLKLGFQFTDALDKTKVELFSYVGAAGKGSNVGRGQEVWDRARN